MGGDNVKQQLTKHSTGGGVLVEASVALAVFLFIILIGIDISIFLHDSAKAQFVAGRVARNTIVGAKTRAQIEQDVIDMGSDLGLSLQSNNIDVLLCTPNFQNTATDCNSTPIGNQPNLPMLLKLSFNSGILSGRHEVNAQAFIVNEPY